MIKADFTMKTTGDFLKDRGLEPGGRVQRYIDETCVRLMEPYTPFRTGVMKDSAIRGTVVGSGEIAYTAPQSRYLYFGKLMVDPTTGSAWAKKGAAKVTTEKDLTYQYAPTRGAFWFERMKNDHKQEILDGAQQVLEGGHD